MELLLYVLARPGTSAPSCPPAPSKALLEVGAGWALGCSIGQVGSRLQPYLHGHISLGWLSRSARVSYCCSWWSSAKPLDAGGTALSPPSPILMQLLGAGAVLCPAWGRLQACRRLLPQLDLSCIAAEGQKHLEKGPQKGNFPQFRGRAVSVS